MYPERHISLCIRAVRPVITSTNLGSFVIKILSDCTNTEAEMSLHRAHVSECVPRFGSGNHFWLFLQVQLTRKVGILTSRWYCLTVSSCLLNDPLIRFALLIQQQPGNFKAFLEFAISMVENGRLSTTDWETFLDLWILTSILLLLRLSWVIDQATYRETSWFLDLKKQTTMTWRFSWNLLN